MHVSGDVLLVLCEHLHPCIQSDRLSPAGILSTYTLRMRWHRCRLIHRLRRTGMSLFGTATIDNRTTNSIGLIATAWNLVGHRLAILVRR